MKGILVYCNKKDKMDKKYTTREIIEAIATFVLLKKFEEKIADNGEYNEYAEYDGSMLPSASGCNVINAMTTYISQN